MATPASASRARLYLGLSLTLLATLLLEIVDSRLLSVLTWYHLSFLAISVAMLGAASGATLVFTARQWFAPSRSLPDLARWSTAFAIAVPASHVLNLVIPVPRGGTWTPMEVVALALAVVVAVLAVPFVFSGIVVTRSLWNSHLHVLVFEPMRGPAYYWGPDAHAGSFTATYAWMLVDGEAGTPMTEWDGDRESLAWVSHDVTALPHHLRHGHAGVIGVGGGRDILSAIWGGSTRITGIEINGRILEVLNGSHRTFTGIADYDGVELVHDEARSYLSRHALKFAVLQMPLVDTWAATGAGAFTLSENGLYTCSWRPGAISAWLGSRTC